MCDQYKVILKLWDLNWQKEVVTINNNSKYQSHTFEFKTFML